MYTLAVFLLVLIIRCSESSPFSSPVIYNEEYLNPKTLDHKSLSGRWYEHSDTLNNTVIDNCYGDVVVLCDETMTVVEIMSRLIPSLKECRTTALNLQFNQPDSPSASVVRISTNAHYYDPHPTEGFMLVSQQTPLTNGYHFITRQMEPRHLNDVIKEILLTLHMNLQDFYVKSKDFGCEWKGEKGVKL